MIQLLLQPGALGFPLRNQEVPEPGFQPPAEQVSIDAGKYGFTFQEAMASLWSGLCQLFSGLLELMAENKLYVMIMAGNFVFMAALLCLPFTKNTCGRVVLIILMMLSGIFLVMCHTRLQTKLRVAILRRGDDRIWI